mgnify:CR=1 FL=1
MIKAFYYTISYRKNSIFITRLTTHIYLNHFLLDIREECILDENKSIPLNNNNNLVSISIENASEINKLYRDYIINKFPLNIDKNTIYQYIKEKGKCLIRLKDFCLLRNLLQ